MSSPAVSRGKHGKRNATQAFAAESPASLSSSHAQGRGVRGGEGEGEGEVSHASKRVKKEKRDKKRKPDGYSSGVDGSEGLVDDDAAKQLLREEMESSSAQVGGGQSQGRAQVVVGEGEERKTTAGKMSKKERKRARKGLGQDGGEAGEGKRAKVENGQRRSTGVQVEAESPATQKKEKQEKRSKKPAADAGATEDALQRNGDGEATAKVATGDGELSKSKMRKRNRALKNAEADKSTIQEAVAKNEDDSAAEEVRLSKREKKRLRKLEKARKEGRTPLEERVEDPKDVKVEDIKNERSDDEDETMLSDGGVALQQHESTPLENRIEAPPRAKKEKGKKSKASGGAAGVDGWTLSKPTGGVFVEQDPIVTSDEQHLILATKNEVRVYSTRTSLLVRSMKMRGETVACVLSSADDKRVIAGRSDGKIVVFDWTTGGKMGEWRSPPRLLALVPSEMKNEDEELVVGLWAGEADERHLAVYALGEDKQAKHVETLLTRKGLNAQFRLHEDAGIIVASAYSRLVIGAVKDLKSTGYVDAPFTWREYPVVGGIVSLDTRCYSVGSKAARNRLDIAVGSKAGNINLYEDLLYKLIGKEKKKQDDDLPIALRSLVWHRTAVNSVKWSRDGNYVISGGNETALVIWQLDTNKQQYLPHLSTEIKRLVVSKRSSSYALLLGDNSVMVLGTADLNPTANIALMGVAGSNSVVAAMHPTKQGRLLTTMPRSIAASKADQATGLQTYDVHADMQVARQALTRNLTTTISVGPDGQPLKEPNVSQLKLSFDGAWLATVEEWTPPSSNLDALHLQEDPARKSTTETTLKFWSATPDGNEWALTNRVDGPYSSDRILALVSCPIRTEFATISSAGVLQTWSPRARRRDGVLVKNARDQPLYNWHVSRKIPLNPSSTPKSASLAYAEDGSLIAASQSTSADTAQWTALIPLTTTSLDPTSITHIPALHPSHATFLQSALVGAYLVTLSPSTLSVYDSINASTPRVISFDGSDYDLSPSANNASSAGEGSAGARRHHLASSPLDASGSFAVALNPTQSYLPARLFVVGLSGNHDHVTPSEEGDDAASVQQAEKGHSPIRYDATLPSHVSCLLPRSGGVGYVVLERDAGVREIRGPGAAFAYRSTLTATGADEGDDLRRGLDALFGPAPTSSAPTQTATAATGEGDAMDVDAQGNEEEATRPRTTKQTLEDALGWQTTASVPSSTKGILERVLGLFRRGEGEGEE